MGTTGKMHDSNSRKTGHPVAWEAEEHLKIKVVRQRNFRQRRLRKLCSVVRSAYQQDLRASVEVRARVADICDEHLPARDDRERARGASAVAAHALDLNVAFEKAGHARLAEETRG